LIINRKTRRAFNFESGLSCGPYIRLDFIVASL